MNGASVICYHWLLATPELAFHCTAPTTTYSVRPNVLVFITGRRHHLSAHILGCRTSSVCQQSILLRDMVYHTSRTVQLLVGQSSFWFSLPARLGISNFTFVTAPDLIGRSDKSASTSLPASCGHNGMLLTTTLPSLFSNQRRRVYCVSVTDASSWTFSFPLRSSILSSCSLRSDTRTFLAELRPF